MVKALILVWSLWGAQRALAVSFSPAAEGLSGLWAQDLVGADLMKSSLQSLNHRPVAVSVLDISFAGAHNVLGNLTHTQIHRSSLYSAHGVAVAALIAQPDVGVSNAVQFRLLWAGLTADEMRLALKTMSQDPDARLINISAALPVDMETGELEAVAAAGKIMITSAGNSAPRRADLDPVKRDFPGLVVGSVDVNGVVSEFSQGVGEVDFYAPGAPGLITSLQAPYTTELANGGETGDAPVTMGFGRTSAATPLMSGTVANLLAVNPNLTLANIKCLLRETGLPVFTDLVSLTPARGRLVNGTLALAMVKADPHSDFCNAQLIASLRHRVSRDAEMSGDALTQARMRFFINPSAENAERVAGIYLGMGLPRNAEYFLNFLRPAMHVAAAM